MKQKVGILLERDLVKRARQLVAKEGRTLDDLIQDALESYLISRAPEQEKRETAYHLFCEQPIRLTEDQFKAVLEEDA
jgi:metal-responsive CopG/Arc/MetJ family transcriptional regulator